MKRKMTYTLITIIVLLIGWIGHLLWVASGKLPTGERLARCEQSPQWKDGSFVNQYNTPQLTGDEGFFKQMYKFLFVKVSNLKPSNSIPVIKTDLKKLDRQEEVCLWLGHSTLFIQTAGIRFLFDPVLTAKLPVTLFMKPFKGADTYTPDDIPDVDYLIITHDHWDHLDYETVKALRNRVGEVICGLGIGAHFEYWGYPKEKIHDVDWGEHIPLTNSEVTLRVLPTRHFSGRLLGRNKTLWTSYLIDGPRRIFISGDGGYDDRFSKIGKDYPEIDLAIMENGQYDKGWRFIHTLPSQLPQAIHELGAKHVMTYHNSKFALANHPWTEPLDSIYEHAKNQSWQLLTPRIGEAIRLEQQQHFDKWW